MLLPKFTGDYHKFVVQAHLLKKIYLRKATENICFNRRSLWKNNPAECAYNDAFSSVPAESYLLRAVAQPEWGRRGHAPPHEANLLRLVLVLYINFQLLDKQKEQSDSRRRQRLTTSLTGLSRIEFLAALLFTCIRVRVWLYRHFAYSDAVCQSLRIFCSFITTVASFL